MTPLDLVVWAFAVFGTLFLALLTVGLGYVMWSQYRRDVQARRQRALDERRFGR